MTQRSVEKIGLGFRRELKDLQSGLWIGTTNNHHPPGQNSSDGVKIQPNLIYNINYSNMTVPRIANKKVIFVIPHKNVSGHLPFGATYFGDQNYFGTDIILYHIFGNNIFVWPYHNLNILKK